MLNPNGIIPAMITPFDTQQRINEQALRIFVNRYIEAGVHGLFCLGTNGEFFSLSQEEKEQVIAIVVEETAGRVPVYAGTGGVSTQETIALTQAAEMLGADAVSVITPYFLPLTQQELTRHYEEVAASTNLPVVLYNMPANTGNALHVNTVKALSKISNITGIKDSSGRMDQLLQYLDLDDGAGCFSVLCGTDSLILPSLLAGGRGGIASTANFAPELVVSIFEYWSRGEMALAAQAQNHLRGLRMAFGWGTLPSVLKEALNLTGWPAGAARAPVTPVSPEMRSKMQTMISYYTDLGIVSHGASSQS